MERQRMRQFASSARSQALSVLALIWAAVVRIGEFANALTTRLPGYLALKSLSRLDKETDLLSLDHDVTAAQPTLALMRRILADAQAKLRVMVEENTATGLRLGEADLDKGGAELRAGLALNHNSSLHHHNNNNNNHHSSSLNSASSASSTSSTSSNSSATSASTPSSSSCAPPGQNSSSGPDVASPASPREQQQQQQQQAMLLPQQEDALGIKRLSTGSSPVDKSCVSPVDRKDGSPIGRLEKTSAGSFLDSRSGSASPVGGSARLQTGSSSLFQRPGSGSSNSSSLRPPPAKETFDKDDPARTDEDNEPPGPAPSSRPCSPSTALGLIGDPVVASRLSNHSHAAGGLEPLASGRRLRLENERLVAEVARLRRLLLTGAARGGASGEDASLIEDEARYVALEMELQRMRDALQSLKADRKRLRAEKFDLLNQMKALYGTLEDKERELRDFIRNYEQRMRESEANMGRMQQPGVNPEDREMERERERWSLLRAARDEADRSLTLAANLAEKEAALSHAHATIKELQRQLAERGGGGGGVCLSDQESLLSFPRSSVNGGAATPGAGSSSGGVQPQTIHGSASELVVLGSAVPLSSGATGASSTGQPGDRGSCSADSGVRGSSDRESGGATSIGGNLSDSTTDGTPTIMLEASGFDVDNISLVSSSIAPPHMYQSTTPKDCSPSLSPLNAFSRSMDNSSLSRSVEQLCSPLDAEPKRSSKIHQQQQQQLQQPAQSLVPQTVHSRSSATRGGTWGSISRVFARSRHRKATNSSGVLGSSAGGGCEGAPEGFDPYRSWSPLTEEGYAEKLRLLREAASVPMERWRAPTVLAWLEVALGMPQYGPRCAENVKSGKVLLELSDAELEAGLGVSHPLHRKKLRLAIEEHRHPNLVRYPCIAQLGHTWVSSEWLPDLGLSQYAESFATNMVDARMLDHLSKKELEKLLGVTRKFHQASIVHGINLLRMLNYDRQALAVRRHNCEQVDADPLVWTNQRFIRWARNIDLAEYADNLKDSGVHGALVVLEPSFTGDTMATALGIPPAKHMIRRHLTAELEAIVLPARGQLEVVPRNGGGVARPMSSVGSMGRGHRASAHIQHHQHQSALLGPMHQSLSQASSSGASSTIDRRRSSLRGSLSRALGLRPRNEKASPSSSSDTGSLASQSQYMSSLRSNSPPPPQLPPRPSTVSGSTKRHRRVKSIGDIEYMSSVVVSTPV
ncbi:kazrin-A isoform X2 [Nasonia vitripennis]|uniref:SAM domain-containing protein n=1 Tax=Nasonia vitripennis TaxID=7425 RepID=A0A7M7ILP7_NASVI|nr:kazrin-A isoform X2 [Nasonia vitripennis]